MLLELTMNMPLILRAICIQFDRYESILGMLVTLHPGIEMNRRAEG